MGAGLAGLTAAWTLQRAHGVASVAVLEARDRPGGRTHSRAIGPNNVRFDLGGQWIGPHQVGGTHREREREQRKERERREERGRRERERGGERKGERWTTLCTLSGDLRAGLGIRRRRDRKASGSADPGKEGLSWGQAHSKGGDYGWACTTHRPGPRRSNRRSKPLLEPALERALDRGVDPDRGPLCAWTSWARSCVLTFSPVRRVPETTG